MIEFLHIWMLLALPLPLVVRFLVPAVKKQSAPLSVPFDVDTLPVSVNKTSRSVRFPTVLLALCWLGMVLAASHPQWVGEPISLPNKGREMLLAVDLSGSMKIEDMQVNRRTVNRLQMVKSVLTEFIERRIGDRLGLILFADTAYLQAPMTYDRNTVSTLLDETVIGLVGEKTAIGDAVGLAVKRFNDKDKSNNVLILLTDGQNTAGYISPQDALSLAQNQNIRIYTIGVGADSMLIESLFGKRQVNPSRDLDESLLSEMARSTGGQYFRARNKDELEAIYSLLDELEPIVGDNQTFRPRKALFYYPLSFSLFCLMLVGLIQIHFGTKRHVL